jgi:prepilin peptidase CpaA
VFAADTPLGVHAGSWAVGIGFTVLMGVAAVSDVRRRRIPNSLVLLIFSLGALFLTMDLGVRAGAVQVLEGASTGMLIWLPVWMMGKIGAGDVKFFAASASWLGPRLTLDATLSSALAGGVVALVWVFRRAAAVRGELDALEQPSAWTTVKIAGLDESRDSEVSRVTLPYGVAMAAGLTFTAWFSHIFR